MKKIKPNETFMMGDKAFTYSIDEQNKIHLKTVLDINPTKKSKQFIPPTLEEVIKFFEENGQSKERATKAFNHYSEGDWHDSRGNKVVNYKQKLRTNWFEDKKEISEVKPTSKMIM